MGEFTLATRLAVAYKQGVIPDPSQVPGLYVMVGDVWSDISGATPVFKICTSTNPITFVSIVSASGVTSLNTLVGDVILAAGSNITLTPAGNTITIASTGGGPAFADAETPGGAINGANTTFTLAAAPSPAASLQLYYSTKSGATFLRLTGGGVDYSLAGSTITTTFAPVTGSALLAYYRH